MNRKPNKLTDYVCNCGTGFTLRRQLSSKQTPRCSNCIRQDHNLLARKAKYYTRPTYREKARQWHLKALYKIALNEYDTLLKTQNGACGICLQPPINKEHFVVDHCHITNKIRGLLCHNCNRALGQFKDSTNILTNAINYLIKNK